MQDRENNLSLIGDFTCMAAHGGPDTVRQTFVLKALQFLAKQKQHTTIVLRSCAVLKLATLMPFLQDTLEHLDISYSSNINSSDISEIQKRCPRLKRLHLEGCGQLRNIRYGFFGGFLSFEHLEELSVKNCANLTSLEIKAPRLKYLYAQNTTSLSSVVLDVESFPLIDLKKSLCVDLKINPLENLCRETLSFENAYHFYMYQLTQLELGFPFNKEQVGTTLDRFKGICEYLRSLAHSMRYPEHVLEKIERLYFGRNKWHRYFGLKVTEPPLPPNIREILKSPCPFWPDKIVAETHFLTLIPEDMTLERLESLTQNSQQGNKIGFIYKDGGVWRQHSQTPSGKAHWVLMTNDVIPGSRSKRWEDQQTLAATFRGQGYELPSVIDVATCILLEYVETGHRFYSNTPFTYTQCVEQVRVESSKWPLIIGGFASGGLLVDYSKAGVYDYLGVGVARKL
jgi:hypothetical protein